MIIRRHRKHGQSTIEFLALVLFILATFLVFQKYIVRGFSGRWKSVGDSLGQGRIYDPVKTVECAFDQESGQWFNQACYDQQNCTDSCFGFLSSPASCSACVGQCRSPFCDD